MCDGLPSNWSPVPPVELPCGRKIGDGQPVFIVAEVGQNHTATPTRPCESSRPFMTPAPMR